MEFLCIGMIGIIVLVFWYFGGKVLERDIRLAKEYEKTDEYKEKKSILDQLVNHLKVSR
jgi:hypothetical protein